MNITKELKEKLLTANSVEIEMVGHYPIISIYL